VEEDKPKLHATHDEQVPYRQHLPLLMHKEDLAEITVSKGAAEKPCTTLIKVNDKMPPAKNPQALVPNKKRVGIRNTGLFPHTAAAAAVKKVPDPVVICSKPTREKEIWSAVTLNVFSISSKPVVIIGPSLLAPSATVPVKRRRGEKGPKGDSRNSNTSS